MFEIIVPYALPEMKAVAQHTVQKSAIWPMGLGIAAIAASLWLGGMAGVCLGLTGSFFLAYPLFFALRFPFRLLQAHMQIAPEAKYTFDANRVMCISGAAIWTWGWDEIRRIIWTKTHVVILCRSGEGMALPVEQVTACRGLEELLRQMGQ